MGGWVVAQNYVHFGFGINGHRLARGDDVRVRGVRHLVVRLRQNTPLPSFAQTQCPTCVCLHPTFPTTHQRAVIIVYRGEARIHVAL